MPRAPKKCGHDGCENRGTGRYCPEHQVRWQTKGATRTGSAEHRAWRTAVLDRCHWWCEIRGPGCEGRAKHADHKTPVAFGGSEYDIDNGQGACPTCHTAKSLAEATEGRRRALLA